MEYALETGALCKYYKHFKAINGLDMHVPRGAIYGFVGRNGSGKTTLIRLVTGLQFPTSGSFSLFGCDSSSRGITAVRRRIGAVVETPSIYMDFSAEDNLRFQYDVLSLPSYATIPELLKLVGLEDTGAKKAKNFSLGMRQRLGIAIALAGNPDLLILDEPINGLDPQGIIEIRELVLRLNRDFGITVIVSSHILDELSRIATHYGFIDKGSMIREMSAEELNASCRKKTAVTVSDTKAFVRVMDGLGFDYRITGEGSAEFYDEITVTELCDRAKALGCSVISMSEQNESLESFYMNLVGGGANA